MNKYLVKIKEGLYGPSYTLFETGKTAHEAELKVLSLLGDNPNTTVHASFLYALDENGIIIPGAKEEQ